MSHHINVSKLDVARRQLEQAIFLFFNDGDPIAVHTLVAAAYNVVHALNKENRTDGKMLKTMLVTEAPEDKRKQIWKKISEAENFFKHADRDSGAILSFNPEISSFLLFDAIRHYKKLTNETSAYFKSYEAWMIITNIGPANVPTELKTKILADVPAAVSMGRNAFFKQVFSVFGKS